MEHSKYLPDEIIYREIIKYCHFETILSIYSSSKESINLLNTKLILEILANSFNVNKTLISTFEDFIIYGSILSGSILALKYHQGYICAVSGAKYNNLKLKELGKKKEKDRSEQEGYINFDDDQNYIDAYIENNQLSLSEYKSLINDEDRPLAFVYALINKNILLAEYILDKKIQDINDNNLLHNIIKYSIINHWNDIYDNIIPKIEKKYHRSVVLLGVEYNNFYVLKKYPLEIRDNINMLFNIAIDPGSLEMINWLYRTNYQFDKEKAFLCLDTCGNLKIIKWFINNLGFNNFKQIFLYNAAWNNKDIIEYLYETMININYDPQEIKSIIDQAAITASKKSHISLLDYFNSIQSLQYDEIGINCVNISVIEWLNDKWKFDKQGELLLKGGFCNYDIFEYCRKFNIDREYYIKAMKIIETCIYVDSMSKLEYKMFKYLISIDIPTDLTKFDIDEWYCGENDFREIEYVGVYPDCYKFKPSILKYHYPKIIWGSLCYDSIVGWRTLDF